MCASLALKYAPRCLSGRAAGSAYKSDGRIHFFAGVNCRGQIYYSARSPSSLSTCPPFLRSLSPSVRRFVVDGDDVKNDTVFVAPFSIKPVAPSFGILLFQQRAHKGAKIIYVLWANSTQDCLLD